MVRPLLVLIAAALLAGWGIAQNDAGPEPETSAACWGQASRVFARTGELGEHSSQQPTPRLGLRNLARALYEQGVIPDDSMAALGAFVADELGLTIEACMDGE